VKINYLEMEWTDEGCVALAKGFDGVMLTCPRCQASLPRAEEHRCGKTDGPSSTPRKMPRRTKPAVVEAKVED